MRRFEVFVVALCMLLAAAGPAAAKDRDPGRDAVAVAEQGEGVAPGAPAWVRERIKRIHEGKIENGEAEPQMSATAQARRRIAWIGCRDVWAYRGYDHFLGYNLFRYYEQVSWCSNGYSIYSWSRFRWPELNGPGWGFDGHIGSYLGGTTTAKQAWTQGAFHMCFAGWCEYKVPWVNIDVNVGGGWSASTGG